jgi:hypothetical protein
VAVIESVNADGTLNVVESNWGKDHKIDRRVVDPSKVDGYYLPPTVPKGQISATADWEYPGATSGSSGSNVDVVADAIIAGTMAPPAMSARPTQYMLQLQAALAKKGFNLAQAQLDWQATQKNVTSLNSTQQLRLRQAINFSSDSLGIIDQLNQAWQGGGLPLLNKVNLLAASRGVNNQVFDQPFTITTPNPDGTQSTVTVKDSQTLATLLNAQINDLTSELGTVYKGGNTSTDESLKLAAGNLSSDWSFETLQSAITLARTNLQIRKNSIANSGAVGTGDNPYQSSSSSAPAATIDNSVSNYLKTLQGGTASAPTQGGSVWDTIGNFLSGLFK